MGTPPRCMSTMTENFGFWILDFGFEAVNRSRECNIHALDRADMAGAAVMAGAADMAGTEWA